MAMLSPPSSLMIFVSISFYVLFLFRTSDASITLRANVTVPALILFGDSIVVQGNNNNLSTIVKCNYPPYGNDFLGGKSTGRFSNGKTPADLIAEELGGTEYDPQTSRLVSVVVGNLRIYPTVVPLAQQVEYFKEYIGRLKIMVGEESKNEILVNSMLLVVAGSSDLANTYFTIGIRKMQYDINFYTDFLVQPASDLAKKLYEQGARRIFFFNIPPVGCIPSERTLAGGGPSGCSDTYNMAAQTFNMKLNNALSSFTSNLNDPKTRVVYIDVYSPLLDIIQKTQKYGFIVTDRGCCGTRKIEVMELCNKYSITCSDPSKCFLWDNFHPTEQGYKVIVGQILEKYIDQFF